MTEGPYRDIGAGLVRLSGLEAPRRAPSNLLTVEDVLLELLKNARDAGATGIYVASSLHARRYRTLLVLDNGEGIPAQHTETIFEPGTTSRHLSRTSGFALYHIKNLAHQATVTNPANPTAIKATLDTRRIPERTLQSASRTSKSNLLATATDFARQNQNLRLYLGTQSNIVSTLLKNNIIPQNLASGADGRGASEVFEYVRGLGFEISARTLKRVLSGGGAFGEPGRSPALDSDTLKGYRPPRKGRKKGEAPAPVRRVLLGAGDRAGIEAIIREAAAANYLSVSDVRFEYREGGIAITADIAEPEEEYDE
ncbi:ATP-binding protein [Rubrobacter indicoceani]|uniref:ATP-binding protein n=1 Tax=Rubrobacter indicoceani TaxID=2051957 RepID=UPI0013C45A01|nr:ATP-binding protein [Rubrobacter indicoceani]